MHPRFVRAQARVRAAAGRAARRGLRWQTWAAVGGASYTIRVLGTIARRTIRARREDARLMQVEPKTSGTEAMYKLMIGCVVPRPIAWVSSVDANGVANLAPFSYFMAITHDPPTIAFSSSPRALSGGGRGKKD